MGSVKFCLVLCSAEVYPRLDFSPAVEPPETISITDSGRKRFAALRCESDSGRLLGSARFAARLWLQVQMRFRAKTTTEPRQEGGGVHRSNQLLTKVRCSPICSEFIIGRKRMTELPGREAFKCTFTACLNEDHGEVKKRKSSRRSTLGQS